MARLTKDAWLSGSDLEERDVEVPELGGTVRIRSLPAAYSNQASSEALVLKSVGRDQVATVDTAKLEVLQFAHGVIEPEFSVEEAEQVAMQFARAFKRVVGAIDEISGVDKEALEAAQARFPSVGKGTGGPHHANGAADPAGAAGDTRSDVPVRAVAPDGKEPA